MNKTIASLSAAFALYSASSAAFDVNGKDYAFELGANPIDATSCVAHAYNRLDTAISKDFGKVTVSVPASALQQLHEDCEAKAGGKTRYMDFSHLKDTAKPEKFLWHNVTFEVQPK